MPKPAAKKTIAVDIDDVISAQNENMRLYANKKYGHSHTLEDYLAEGSYWGYWGGVWGVSDEEQERRVQEYNHSGQLGRQAVVPGAVTAIKKLKERFNLIIITSRSDEHFEETHQWLAKHFKSAFQHVHFASVWDNGEKTSKANICRAVGAGYLIDDNAEHCNLAAEAGIKPLLFGIYGWNRTEPMHKNVTRVKDWQEVLGYFDAEG